ncbi:MAG: energy-coupling factor transporter transmembrane component T family protein, partial [Anaerolineales bacterium]
MLVNWKYRPRNTFIQRLDPRARLAMLAAMIIAFTQLWDMRVVLPLFSFALLLYLLARIEWKDVRRPWLFILFFVGLIVVVNTILGARGGPPSVRNDQSELLWQWAFTVPGVGWNINLGMTVNRMIFLPSQFMRMIGMSLMAIPIPFTFAPTVYGVAFRQIGLSDKVAYSIDLAFRLVPTLGRDFNTTLDAQRARGYELERLRGGLFERLRKLAPLLVPVVVHAIVGGEEIIDAMDLRAFGTRARTWSQRLKYAWRDYAF